MINDSIRDEFSEINDNFIYFDNSSTTKKPKCVIETINNYYTKNCFNSSRGSYSSANKINKEIENTRVKVAQFLNAKLNSEIIFTNGATHSSNMIAYSYGLKNLKSNDEILLCYTDHKSTILPWINLKDILSSFNVEIKINEIYSDIQGDYNEEKLLNSVNEKTKIVVLTHIHNLYGIENSVKLLTEQIKEINPNALVIVDASQSVGHIKVDVQELNCDFLYFSGHKMFAGNGVGVLYVKSEIQKLLSPFMVGGNFGGEKSLNGELNNYKRKSDFFENGTLNIPSILSLKSAIEFIENLGIENIENRLYDLTRYLYEKLKTIKNIEFDKGIDKCSCNLGYGIISFKISGIDSTDIAYAMDEYNICFRAGKHCLTKNAEDSIRVSLAIYNTKNEIDKFCEILNQIIS